MSVLAQDLQQIEAKQRINLAQELVAAARSSGRSPIAIALDYLKFRRGRSRLKFYEYLLYELYDTARWTEDERSRFISAHRHWPIVNQCNSMQWWAASEDKWLASALLDQAGIPTTTNVAVFDRSGRYYGALPKLDSAEAVERFFRTCDDYPLFAKNMDGMWSAGAFRISGCTDTHILIEGHDPVSFGDLFDGVIGDNRYIVQRCLQPHSFFDGITHSTATVRCLNLIRGGEPWVPFTLLKLPMGANVADNFWRPGNVLCQLAPDTGEVVSVVTVRDGRLQRHDSLPNSDRRLIGERLPFWDALRQVNRDTAMLYAGNRFGSTDIALTSDGPVVVEVNNGCAFELIQMATGKGFLTDEILAFFDDCGARL